MRRTWTLTVVGVLLLSLLSACSSSSKNITSLTIGSSVNSLFSLPLYIADLKGYFKEEGLEVKVMDFNGGAEATRALMGGSLQMQSAGTENLLKVVQAGEPVVAVMTVQSTLNGGLVVTKQIADKFGGKPTLRDMKGWRIGTLARGGAGDMAARYLLNSVKLDGDKDATLMPLAGYDKHIAAFQAGDLDASLTVEPIQTLLVDGMKTSVYVVDFLKGEGPDVFQNMNWITLQAKKEFVQQNKGTVEKVMRAMIKAQSFIADPKNLDEVTTLSQKVFPNVQPPVLKASIAKQLHTYTPEITQEGIKKNNELLLVTGNLKAAVSYEKAVDTSFSSLWKAYKKP